jgi:alpha-N-arabinofuranosidase
MRLLPWTLGLALAWLASGCGDDHAGIPDGGVRDTGTADAPIGDAISPDAPLPPPPSCGDSGPAPCLVVDTARPGHRVSRLLFGDNIEWMNDGNHIWDPQAQIPRAGLVDPLRGQGVTLIRYPGGTPSDFFHFAQAIGPVGSRQPQIDPFQSTSTNVVRQVPTFGPDELPVLARQLGADLLITVNAGTGTADEAAAWLAHYKAAGIAVRYWEVGN